MTAGVCYSIAERPGIVRSHYRLCGKPVESWLLRRLVDGICDRLLHSVDEDLKLPKWMVGLMPVMIIPVIATFVCGVGFFAFVAKPMALPRNALQGWIMSLNGGSKFIIGAVIGAGMGFDMGGPVNKTASMAANALGADGIYGPMSAKIIGGMTPPCGVFVSTLLTPKKILSDRKREPRKRHSRWACASSLKAYCHLRRSDPARFIPLLP